MRLTLGSLFAGVGGFDVGMEAAGFEIAWMVEIDKDCVSVLERHYPHVPRWCDIRDVDPADFEPVEVITAGFPCQDLSVAGKQAGLLGARSGLFWEAVRIVREMRDATDGRYPAFVVLENVPGLLSSDRGRDFAAVLGGLRQLGAAVGYRVLDARFFGVPQRRRRVFIVAGFAGGHLRAQRTAEVLSLFSRGSGDLAASGAERQGTAGPAENGAGVVGEHPRRKDVQTAYEPDVAFTLRHNPTGSGSSDNAWNTTYVPIANSVTASAGHHGHSSPRGDGSDNLIAFHLTQDPINGAESPALGAGNEHGCSTVAVAISENQRAEVLETPYAHQLSAAGGKPGQGYQAVREGMAVRRLTPVECEKLMGWPSGWTERRADGSLIPDGPRYRMIGNGVVAPVARWLGERLRAALEA